MDNDYIARRFYINGAFWLIDFDDFLYLSNNWAEWLIDYESWDKGIQEKRKYSNCDEFVSQSLYEDKENRKNIIIDETCPCNS